LARAWTEEDGTVTKNLGLAFVTVLALLVFAPGAMAGGYVGGSILETKLAIDEDGFDEDDTGWKVFGGYNFFRFFGLEAAYYDMGEPTGNDYSADLNAWALSARGILPLGKHFELFAKVGYMAWEADLSDGFSDDDTDLTYGAGVAIIFGSHVEVRAEYEVLDVDDADLDIVSVGAAFRF
jgi:OOP family OmpA-OmpF porin